MASFKLTLTFVAACLIAAAAIAQSEPDYWPTDGWRVSSPEEQGVDSQQLAAAVARLRERHFPIHSLLVIRNGYAVLDAYFPPFGPGQMHDVASVTKSFTSTLVGIAIDQGRIGGVDRPVLSFFPNRKVENLDASKEAMTLEDLLTMRAGLKCVVEPTEVTLFEMISSPDWVQFILDSPMADPPGTKFLYNSGVSHLLSAILHETTEMRESDFARENLFGPLGIREFIWPTDPRGSDSTGWGCLRITPHSMAKLGFLFLNKGKWEGKQIVSKAWVEAATSQKVTFSESESEDNFETGYGYQWWIHPEGFGADGRGGQFIQVFPKKNLIVVFTGGGRGVESLKLLNDYILPAVRADGDLPANPDGMAALDAAIAAPAAEQREDAKRLPRIARKVSGKTYTMVPNLFGLSSIRFEFSSKEEAAMTLTLATYDAEPGGIVNVRVGLDGVPRLSPGRFGLPASAVGEWDDGDILAVDYNEIGNINHWRLKASFEEKTLELRMTDMTGLGSLTITGECTE